MQAIYIIIIIISFETLHGVYISLQINTLLCNTLVSVLVSLERAILLDIACLAWYCSNPNDDDNLLMAQENVQYHEWY